MMKKPLNMPIRPMPPYGEFAPSCGTNWSAETERQRPSR